ncbi:hypothetical protein ACIOGX_36490 [Streptomyces sp. NPDC088147]|uniref:hypothetical protein n=1 Tax=Streptomyces sp. NPDC088147 TaxID=3365830 RepID=UPI00381311E9
MLTGREEKNSVTIGSNESFSGRTKTFTDPRLCSAVVDRFTFGGNITDTGTYRLSHHPRPSGTSSRLSPVRLLCRTGPHSSTITVGSDRKTSRSTGP